MSEQVIVDGSKTNRMAAAHAALARKRAAGVLKRLEKENEKIEEKLKLAEEKPKEKEEMFSVPPEIAKAILQHQESLVEKEIIPEPVEKMDVEIPEEEQKKMSSSEEIEVRPIPKEEKKKKIKSKQKKQIKPKKRKRTPKTPVNSDEDDSASDESSEEDLQPPKKKQAISPIVAKVPHPIVAALHNGVDMVRNVNVPPAVSTFAYSSISTLGWSAVVFTLVIFRGMVQKQIESSNPMRGQSYQAPQPQPQQQPTWRDPVQSKNTHDPFLGNPAGVPQWSGQTKGINYNSYFQ